jgi:hypothetical protein
LIESKYDPRTFDSDTMLNYHLFRKLKLIVRDKFNHLIITLTMMSLDDLVRCDDFFCELSCQVEEIGPALPRTFMLEAGHLN